MKPKPRRRRRWGMVVLTLVLLAAGAYLAIAQPWSTPPARVIVEAVALGPVAQVLAVNGRVAAREAVRIRSSVTAQAIEVAVDEGESVAAGDLLVRLDTSQPRAQVDQARAALDAGLVRQQQAEAAAERARALGENVTRVAREEAELALVNAGNEVARLRAALDQAESQLALYTLTAPLAGVVLDRAVDRGQLVDPQSALFTVADLGHLVVETDVDEIYSARMQNGLRALLRPAGSSVPQNGTVIFAAPTVDPATGGRTIKIAFDAPVDLPVGLTVNANIIVSETESALSVPRGAILTEGTGSHVLLVEDGLAVLRAVEFLDWPAERVMVTDGLAVGDRVILEPDGVEPEQAVEVD
ncbi:efflux RND transporter periplasmic adaptor subunit [Arsenicitalea aurantiaca]|nr:efflux RND transporter periplasmic adaptor subunit [Arsenicitalea aurantiaca]